MSKLTTTEAALLKMIDETAFKLVKNRNGRKRVLSPDDWYPTAADGTIEVSIHRDSVNNWRIAVWGDDDFGLEKPNLNFTEAFDTYWDITDGITQEGLIKRGFIPA